VGRTFVALYYWGSPPVADLVREHAALKTATQAVLRSLIWSARSAETSPASVLVLICAPAGGACAGRSLWRRRGRGRAASRDRPAAWPSGRGRGVAAVFSCSSIRPRAKTSVARSA